MSTKTGTTISCDRHECGSERFGPTPEAAREEAILSEWTQTEDGRDFCRSCTELRAARKSPSELAPEGVRVMEVFDAAEACGFEKRDYNEETGEAHFYCCGSEVEYASFLGVPYLAKCNTCGAAIGDLLGPSFGNASVAFADSSKVDIEDLRSWVIASEMEAALKATEVP